MGSSGSGSFSDYPGTKAKEVPGDGAGMAGGDSGVDRCQQAFTSVLDDVGLCDFFSRTGTVPEAGDRLTVIFDGKRVFGVDMNGVKVGAFPTKRNYLAACLASGVTYVGVVKGSAVSPVPTVEADFAPQ